MSKNKDASTCDAVLGYLRSQNRPYSVNDIVQNLHKEHGKTAVQKAVDKLVQVSQSPMIIIIISILLYDVAEIATVKMLL